MYSRYQRHISWRRDRRCPLLRSGPRSLVPGVRSQGPCFQEPDDTQLASWRETSLYKSHMGTNSSETKLPDLDPVMQLMRTADLAFAEAFRLEKLGRNELAKDCFTIGSILHILALSTLVSGETKMPHGIPILCYGLDPTIYP